ncbi:F-box protein At2g39490-like [Bidens hawaiensis]|uniref:F-box protein At2g39490-like n=1 Tax=Bidens hawaiensis TaxID=980011 RepID=UPI00404B87EF
MEQESAEINEDHISKLPNDVLRQILSIHPLNSGSKAVALLRRLLKETSIITVKTDYIESVIGDILVKFDEKKPMKNPTNFEFHLTDDLIMTASLGLNQKLHLDFSKGHDQEEIPTPFWLDILLNTMDFALSLSYSLSVKTLKLTSVNYRTVKTLKLTSVNYLSCDFVSSLISKFRYVESLIIEKCEGPWALSVEGLAKLKSLRVLDCDDIELVFLKAWELDSLWYSGPLCRFCLENTMHLRDVKLDIKGPGINNDYHLSHTLYNPLLRAIRDVSVLTLHGWMVKVKLLRIPSLT